MTWELPNIEGQLGLDRQFCVRGSDDRILCALVLGVTLYVEAGDRPEVRSGMLRVLERFEQIAGAELVFGMNPETELPERLPPGGATAYVAGWRGDVFERFDFQMVFTGGPREGDAAPLRFISVSRDREPGQLSYLSLSLPLAWTEQHSPAEFAAFVLELCEMIGPCHGSAGFAAIPHVTGFDQESEKPLFDLARTFSGLDLDLPDQHEPFLVSRGGIKGVNWLTILDQAWVRRAGGPALLQALEHTPSSILRFGHGVVIQAGERPLLGLPHEQRLLDSYRRVATALAPIIITDATMMRVSSGSGGFDQAEAASWLRRFAVATI